MKTCIICSLTSPKATSAADLPNLPLDIDNQTFCVKEVDAFDRDYHHVMIIIDRRLMYATARVDGKGPVLRPSSFSLDWIVSE